MPRKPKEDYEAAMDATATALITLRRPSRVVAHLQERFGIARRTGYRYIELVRERWAKEEAPATAEGRAIHQNSIRATINEVMTHAWNRRKVVKDSSGNPVMDPATGRPTTVADPDLRTVLDCTKQLRELDAMDEAKSPTPVPIIPMVADAAGKTMGKLTNAELIEYARTGRLPAPSED